ncbi:hypothetical protein LguiB_010216 [Lonicera macranthoides]
MTKSNIPEDLVIEILKRLPVRSLMRLRCVCKTWCALTNNPDFVNLHLQFNHTHVSDNRLVVKHWDEAANTNIFSLFPRELEDGLPLTLNLDLQSKGIIEKSIKIAYCDGIFCIYDRSSRLISLWNPAIREFKTLPFLSYLSANEDTYRHLSQLGFGFDCRKTNGYRVIVLISSLYPEGQDFCPAHVYSQRTNSWRVVDCFVPFIRGPAGDTSICTNGFLHWPNMACYPSVLSFDLGEESFQETPILGLPEKANYRIDLASIDGSVAVIQSWIGKHSERGSFCDVWVMKELGVKESWTHKYSVKFSPNLECSSLGLWKSGELLLNLEEHLYLYDPNTQQTKDLGLQDYMEKSEMINSNKEVVDEHEFQEILKSLTKEDLKDDINLNVKKIAEFLEFPFTEEEENKGLVEEISELCEFENLKNLQINKVGIQTAWLANRDFFRKGQVGDWVNYLSLPQAERLEKITKEKLSGSGLTFKSFCNT